MIVVEVETRKGVLYSLPYPCRVTAGRAIARILSEGLLEVISDRIVNIPAHKIRRVAMTAET